MTKQNEEMTRTEIRRLSKEIKKLLSCEEIRAGWTEALEEKCTEENKLDDDIYLFYESGFWIVRDFYLLDGEEEIVRYYYCTEKVDLNTITYLERLNYIYMFYKASPFWLTRCLEDLQTLKNDIEHNTFSEMILQFVLVEEFYTVY